MKNGDVVAGAQDTADKIHQRELVTPTLKEKKDEPAFEKRPVK